MRDFIARAKAALAQGAARLGNPLLRSTIADNPWEDFDRADGTLAGAFGTSKSGHYFTISGPGAAVAYVQDGKLYTTNSGATGGNGNIYFNAGESPGLITEAQGLICFEQRGDGSVAAQQACLMLNGTGPIDLNGKLLHVEFTPGNVSPKITTTGAGNLVPLGGTMTEIDGIQGPGVVPLDGTPCKVGLRFVQKASADLDELYIRCPDGRTLKYIGDTAMRTVMATCKWATGQIQTPSASANSYDIAWAGISQGPNRAKYVTAMGNRLSDPRFNKMLYGLFPGRFERKKRIMFRPTAAGWYTIATHVTPSVVAFMGGRVKLFAGENGGRFTAAEFTFGIESGKTPIISKIDAPIRQYSGTTAVTQFRISRNANAGYQLDVYVSTYNSSTADYVIVDLEGFFTVFAAPVVGATALATASWERDLTLSDQLVADGGANTDFTMTPGITPPKRWMGGATSPNKTITLDDTKAVEGDYFHLTRPASAANGYNVNNGSDAALIKLLASGSWARFELKGGKFVLAAYGTL